jgi:threonine dehydratase
MPTQTRAIEQAAERIGPYVRTTPLDHSLYLSQLLGAEVFLKLENVQHTGSFKVRGAMNKLLVLAPQQRQAGVVTASSGNHGAAVAYGARALGLRALIFVPEHAAPTKVATIRQLGGELRFAGDDVAQTEGIARHYAAQHELAYIAPYNDWDVVIGQGTIAIELLTQLPDIEVVFVTVGGGGLIGGIASYLKSAPRPITVVGCLPERSPVMAASVQAGRIVEWPSLPTLSDGSAGGIEPDSITFSLCRDLVDDYVLISEEEIAAALRLALDPLHYQIEGAAAVALAGLLKRHELVRGRRAAVIVCGANISLATLASIICERTVRTDQHT